MKKFILTIFAVSFISVIGCDIKLGKKEDKKDPTVPLTIVDGGLALSYTDGDGKPEIKATPVITPSTVATVTGTSSNSITVTVPVDSDVDTITFTPVILVKNPSVESEKTASYNSVSGTISGGIATATIELFPTTVAAFYAIKVGMTKATGGTPLTISYEADFSAGKLTYGIMSFVGSNYTTIETGVSYSTFQVTATSAMGTSASDPILISKDIEKKIFVMNGKTVYAKVASSITGKLYSIRMLNAATGISMTGSGSPLPSTYLTSATEGNGIVMSDSGTGASFSLTNSSTTPFVVKIKVRENSVGTLASPVAISLKTPVTGASNIGSVLNYYTAPVTAGTAHWVQLWNLPPSSAGAEMTIYSDSALTTVIGTIKKTDTTSTSGIGYWFNPSVSTIYFTVKGTTGSASENFGALYNIIVQPDPVSEGSRATPVAVVYNTNQSGNVAVNSTSTYGISGAPASGKVILTGLTTLTNVFIFIEGSTYGSCTIDPVETSDQTCSYSGFAPGGTLLVEISSTFGSYYTFKVQ